MPATYGAILSAVKTAIEAVTVSGATELETTATNVIIAAEDTDLTNIKGMVLVVIAPGDRPIEGYKGGLHQVTTNIMVKVCRRLNVDQVAEDETRLTSGTLGLLALDDAIVKALIRDKLTAQLSASTDLDEPLELIAHSRPRTRAGGWVIVDQTYRAMYSQTVTALKA